jgi:hypothetical protein
MLTTHPASFVISTLSAFQRKVSTFIGRPGPADFRNECSKESDHAFGVAVPILSGENPVGDSLRPSAHGLAAWLLLLPYCVNPVQVGSA